MPEVNSWAWVTFKTIAPNDPESLVGYSFDPYATYQEMKFRDFDDDGFVEAQNNTGAGTPANDGVRIDTVPYQISHHWAFNATVKYSDGTELLNQNIMVMRLIDHNGSTTTYHNRLIFRIHDESINDYYEGQDGAGGNKYPMVEISEIIITEYEADQTVFQRDVDLALDDPYPKIVCFVAGTLIETECGKVAVENLKIGNMLKTLDHGFQPIL